MSVPGDQAWLADRALCIELALEVRERFPNRKLEDLDGMLQEAWGFDRHVMTWPEARRQIALAHRLDWATLASQASHSVASRPEGTCDGTDEPRWQQMTEGRRDPHWQLCLCGVEIARVWSRPGSGMWHATLSMHLPWQMRIDRKYDSEQAARRACTTWARTNLDAVRAAIRGDHLRAVDDEWCSRPASSGCSKG